MMNRLKWLIKVLMMLSMISVSYYSVASTTKKVSLSLEWSETDHILYRQNCALKSLQPCTLTLIAGTNTPVFLTITNNSTRTTAVNIRAILPPALADVVQNASNCTQLLPSQQCQIAFTPGNTVHPPTTVPVRGDNTMSYDVILQVIANSFTVGGSISGLSAQGLVLQNNSGDNLPVGISSTSFQFTAPLNSGSMYNVTVLTQPSGLTCLVTNGSGVIGISNITNVSVACSPSGSFAYVPNFGSNTVSRCFIDANGLFSTITPCSTVLTGQLLPSDVAINPARTMAYTVSSSTNKTVVNCMISPATGLWSSCQTSTLSFIPKVIAFNSSGTRAYVTSSTSVYLCNLNPNGTLDSISCIATGPTVPTVNILSSIAVNQAGTKAYLTDNVFDRVYTCDINILTGEIAAVCAITNGPFNEPEGVTLNPAGTYLYVVNNNVLDKNVVVCPVNPNGSLGACSSTGPFNIFSGVGKVAFNAFGTKIYVPYASSTDRVNVCDINLATGQIVLNSCTDSQGTGFTDPAGLAIY